jgi:SOS-response transcriptional repressor LexA
MPRARRKSAKERAGLTHQQARALAFIRQEVAEKGVSPSYTSVARHCGLATRSGAAKLLDALENRGYITRERGRARSILLTREPVNLLAGLPDDLRLEVGRLARVAKVDPNDLIIEAVRDGLKPYRAIKRKTA